MSKQNKVNRDAYTQAGRLTPDDAARERGAQKRQPGGGAPRRRGTQPSPKRARRTRVRTAP
jgi:hypothetical protein